MLSEASAICWRQGPPWVALKRSAGRSAFLNLALSQVQRWLSALPAMSRKPPGFNPGGGTHGNKEYLETVADMEDAFLPVVKKNDDGSLTRIKDLSDLKKAFLLGEKDKLIFIKEDI